MELNDLKKIKKAIQIEVNIADPWYLIEMSAPEDEYNSQVDRIVSFVVNKKPSLGELKSELLSIFKTKEHELNDEKIETLAKRILEKFV